jgi:hypothetical protein
MRIAFDLDDTLIPCGSTFPLEPRPRLARLFGAEPLRQGTIELCRSLRHHGNSLWVYTTSMRRPLSVYSQFLLHGIRLEGVVNQDRHVRRLRNSRPGPHECSKYPPAFQIDLLVDNSVGVWEEGRRFGFRVHLVDPGDLRWTEAIRRKAGL